MIVFGITGGTGAGKTSALRVLEKLGAYLIDCDALYYQMLQPGTELHAAISETFGQEIFDEKGSLNRQKLGNMVFGHPEELKKLNEIIYHYVGDEIRAQIKKQESLQTRCVAVDGINMIQTREAGMFTCDCMVGVVAPDQLRLRRIMARDNISEEYAQKRIDAQQPNEFYYEHCDAILENIYESQELFEQTVEIFFGNLMRVCEKEKMTMEQKKLKAEELLYAPKNGCEKIDEAEAKACETYCEGYKQFLDAGKTERECAREAVAQAEKLGFRPFVRGEKLKAGDKIYRVNRDRGVILAVIGTESLEKGVQIAGAHIDAPRLDLKPSPLYEDSELAYLKTHYYGGIRKYQWVAIPLELRGVIALKSGEVVNVSIGHDVNDPKLVIEDLLPHLGAEQSRKPLGEAIPAETLNILVGSQPLEGAEKDAVKLNVLTILNEKYGITEEDFISAELIAVPAFNATDIGLDRSMIGAYGQDDRVCSYAALKALFDVQAPTKTAVCLLVDKEEIGSVGVSGMQSMAFDTFMTDLCEAYGDVSREVCYENSFCLSADVTAAYDPNFAEAYEKRNSARLNYGIGLCKYTGSRGKSGASDASAEIVARVRKLLDENSVLWQMSEMGKVDYGGGGTIAQYMANRNIDTLDAGVAVLSMHAPFETVSKLDCYMTYKAMKALYEEK